jgi:hypothetical protein
MEGVTVRPERMKIAGLTSIIGSTNPQYEVVFRVSGPDGSKQDYAIESVQNTTTTFPASVPPGMVIINLVPLPK